jgi:hypothetical protein
VVKDIIGLPMTPSGYAVWQYDDYPVTPNTGDSLGFTSDTFFVIQGYMNDSTALFGVQTQR